MEDVKENERDRAAAQRPPNCRLLTQHAPNSLTSSTGTEAQKKPALMFSL